MYKVILSGGDFNGTERYYQTLKIAKQQAHRYVTRCYKKFGISNNAYADIYKKGKHIASYG